MNEQENPPSQHLEENTIFASPEPQYEVYLKGLTEIHAGVTPPEVNSVWPDIKAAVTREEDPVRIVMILGGSGVGKTTVRVNMAEAFEDMGYQTISHTFEEVAGIMMGNQLDVVRQYLGKKGVKRVKGKLGKHILDWTAADYQIFDYLYENIYLKKEKKALFNSKTVLLVENIYGLKHPFFKVPDYLQQNLFRLAQTEWITAVKKASSEALFDDTADPNLQNVEILSHFEYLYQAMWSGQPELVPETAVSGEVAEKLMSHRAFNFFTDIWHPKHPIPAELLAILLLPENEKQRSNLNAHRQPIGFAVSLLDQRDLDSPKGRKKTSKGNRKQSMAIVIAPHPPTMKQTIAFRAEAANTKVEGLEALLDKHHRQIISDRPLTPHQKQEYLDTIQREGDPIGVNFLLIATYLNSLIYWLNLDRDAPGTDLRKAGERHQLESARNFMAGQEQMSQHIEAYREDLSDQERFFLAMVYLALTDIFKEDLAWGDRARVVFNPPLNPKSAKEIVPVPIYVKHLRIGNISVYDTPDPQ